MNEAVPWWSRFPRILGYPLNARGLLACVFLGIASYIGSLGGLTFGLIIRLAASGLVFSTLFLVIRESANGSEDVPEITVTDLWDDLFAPGIKATILSLALFGPVIWFFLLGAFSLASGNTTRPNPKGGETRIVRDQPPPSVETLFRQGDDLAAGRKVQLPPADNVRVVDSSRPIPGKTGNAGKTAVKPGSPNFAAGGGWFVAAIIAAVIAVLIYPLCFIVLAIGGSLRMALFPVVWVTILRQVFLPYLGLLLGLTVLGLIGSAAAAPIGLAGQAIPVFPSMAMRMVGIYFSLCEAHLLGWFVFQYHGRLGYQPHERRKEMDAASVAQVKADTLAYAAGRAPPSRAGGGVRVGNGGVAPAPQIYQGPDPSTTGAPQNEEEIAGLAARFSAACVNRDLASASASAPILLEAYWTSAQMEAAHGVYRRISSADPDFSFPPDSQLRLSKEIETSGDFLLAATGWRALALKFGDHPQAPRALFRCAECYAKSGHPDWAKRALQILVERYPMSEIAGAARARLK